MYATFVRVPMDVRVCAYVSLSLCIYVYTRLGVNVSIYLRICVSAYLCMYLVPVYVCMLWVWGSMYLWVTCMAVASVSLTLFVFASTSKPYSNHFRPFIPVLGFWDCLVSESAAQLLLHGLSGKKGRDFSTRTAWNWYAWNIRKIQSSTSYSSKPLQTKPQFSALYAAESREEWQVRYKVYRDYCRS